MRALRGGRAEICVSRSRSAQVKLLPLWQLTHEGTRIRREFTLPDFRTAIKLLNNVAALAERERHHPDLQLESFSRVWIEIYTHAIGGLSSNDFVLAAKSDAIAPPASPPPHPV